MIKILFLDQSGKIGGAELSLIDVAACFREHCLVGLFEDGPYRTLLEQHRIPTRVLKMQPIEVRRQGHLGSAFSNLPKLMIGVKAVANLSREFDVIYANTQKALVIGGLASAISHRPLVYHLRDILSTQHFSRMNCRVATLFANYFASLVIANSKSTQEAFIQAGGCPDRVHVVYNGFEPAHYQVESQTRSQTRSRLGLGDREFVIGHFSRLSPWKGQHVLIQALAHCPPRVSVLLVGGALFGEDEYVATLHQQIAAAGLTDRVKFLGFQSDVLPLMAACDLVTHTSTSPEPFGRVIVEAMLARKPVIAAAAGGAMELVEHGKTGWLVPPGDALKLAEAIAYCYHHTDQADAIARQAQITASQRFHLTATNQQIANLLHHMVCTEANITVA